MLVGCDCSAGCGDWSVAQFLSKNRYDVPLIWSSKRTAVDMTNALFPILEKIYDLTEIKPLVAYERNNGGFFEMDRLAAMNRLGKYTIFQMPAIGTDTRTESNKYGWDTNTATRPAMLQSLKDVIDNKVLMLYDNDTIAELFSFIVVRTNASVKAQAERHAHDDRVMALAIANKLYELSPSVESVTVSDERDPQVSFVHKPKRGGY